LILGGLAAPGGALVANRDPRGYYRALNVSADASPEEIILAYRFLKQSYRERREKLDIARIQAAYDTLSDQKRRAAYDRRDAAGRRRAGPGKGRFGSPAILVGLMVVLAVVLAWSLGPSLRVAMTSFEPGDELVLRSSGAMLGTVEAYEPQHRFHNGAVAPAYLVRESSGAEAEWYPVGDLARLTRTR
jgi:curved DNA-binding protein CbpA